MDSIDDRSQLGSLVRRICLSNELGSEGANVTFWSSSEAQKIQCVSWERGINDFTLACGTGAVAAAYDHLNQAKSGAQGDSCRVYVPGGELSVSRIADAWYLIGPAVRVFMGSIKI